MKFASFLWDYSLQLGQSRKTLDHGLRRLVGLIAMITAHHCDRAIDATTFFDGDELQR